MKVKINKRNLLRVQTLQAQRYRRVTAKKKQIASTVYIYFQKIYKISTKELQRNGYRGCSAQEQGGGGGGGRDEVWDRETMFSQLAKRSPCVMVSG